MTLKPLLLCAVVSGALLSPVHAQTSTNPNQPTKSGYELLAEAGKLLLPGPNGGADNVDLHISPAENLRRERLAVAREAPALALVREAIRAGVSIPTPKTYSDTFDFRFNARNREFARQLSQESDVRFADGDFVGAMNSKLDTMELGAVIGRGSLIGGFVGDAVESIGFKGNRFTLAEIEQIAPHLDAQQCEDAAARLASIEKERASFSEILQQESQETQTLLIDALPDIQKHAQTSEGRKANDFSQEQADQIIALTPDKLRADTSALFAPAIEHAARPYAPQLLLLPPTPDPLLESKRDLLANTNIRFPFERERVANLLLEAALELRAQKLEQGAYPDTFQTPLDPFSPASKPLVYRKTATGYLLYSVGPDGVDDGGKAVSGRLGSNSRGDLVQTPF